MHTVQFDAPFEIRKLELREVMPPVFGRPFLILRDKGGRWIFDPYMVGIEQTTAFNQAHEQGKPVYAMRSHMFADLEWLLSEAMKPYRKTLPHAFGDENIPFERIAQMFIEMAERLPGELVEVRMIREVPNVFSKH